MAVLTTALARLRADFNTRFPARDKASDGWIGNAAHQKEASGHNPDDTAGSRSEYTDTDSAAEVRALDVDTDFHEPGVTAQMVVDNMLRTPADLTRLRYMIYNQRIWSRNTNWQPREYTGASAHTEHIHFEAAWTQAADNNTTFDFKLEQVGKDWFTMATKADLKAALKELILSDADVRAQLQALPWQYKGGGLHGAGTSLEALGDTQDLVAALGTLAATVADVQAAIENPTGNPTHPIAK